jgi:hypothetical protein
MQNTFRTKTLITKGGKLSIKGLPFHDGESVEVTVRRRKKSVRMSKYPLRGKPLVYRDPFKSASIDWEVTR